jgi:hypothetical protein
MFSTQRQSEILRLVRAQQTCTITELAEVFAVSDETIRRDIKPLISEGVLLKVHGGVMLPDRLDEPPFQRRMQENLEAKRVIAARVCDLVRDGDSLILDGGTTCVHIANAHQIAYARRNDPLRLEVLLHATLKRRTYRQRAVCPVAADGRHQFRGNCPHARAAQRQPRVHRGR